MIKPFQIGTSNQFSTFKDINDLDRQKSNQQIGDEKIQKPPPNCVDGVKYIQPLIEL